MDELIEEFMEVNAFKEAMRKQLSEIAMTMEKSKENITYATRKLYFSSFKVKNNSEKFQDGVEEQIDYLTRRMSQNLENLDEIAIQIQNLEKMFDGQSADVEFYHFDMKSIEKLEQQTLDYHSDIQDINELLNSLNKKCNTSETFLSRIIRRFKRKEN